MGGGGCRHRFGVIAAHVFLERAFIAEGVVPCSGLLGEKAVEASWRAVAWYGGVGAAAVAGVVVGL